MARHASQETPAQLPAHVGVIMDGNGRWAARRGLPRNAGHKQGAEAFGKIARHAAKVGIEYLTVYAFSTENWKRPPEEVEGIMNLLRSYLSDAERHIKENIRVCVLGGRETLAEDLIAQIDDLERRSKRNTGMRLNIAFNYGGRDEILRAARKIAETRPAALDEETFAALLDTCGQPDVDLLIRTGGERRISNFLLWQSAYAEFVFSDILWPDYRARHFDEALEQYAVRVRRMGGTDRR